MVLTTPRRSMALAASILAAFGTAQGQVVPVRVMRMSPGSLPISNPCPIVQAIDRVHDACSAEIQMCGESASPTIASLDGPVSMIQRREEQQEQDPLEALFGFPSMSVPDDLRSMVASDPFLRMAATPANSPSTSSSMMEDLFGDFDRMVDHMMDSALRFGDIVSESSGDDNRIVVVRDEEPEQDASPADIAEATFERMVNSMFEHAVSASRSQLSQASRRSEPSATEGSADEEDDQDHSQAPRAGSDEDMQREVLSHDTGDEGYDAIEAAYGGLDPIAMARRIAQRGKIILNEEEGQHIENDIELRQRRRLTVEDEAPKKDGIRQRLARRLTEVVSPFVGIPTRVVVQPIEDGSGMRVMVSQPIHQLRLPSFLRPPAPAQHTGPTPRLMLGFPVDNCLWDVHDGETHQVSPQCSASLDNVRALHARLLEEEEQRENTIMNILNEIINGDSESDSTDFRENATVTTSLYYYRGPASDLLFWLWMTVFIVSIFACLSCDDDDEEEEEEQNEECDAYHALKDNDESSEKRKIHVYAGIPVQVV